MPHPLEQKICETRRGVRRLLTLYGMSWVVGSLVTVLLLLGLADYLVRFQDRGIRTICTLSVLAVTGWTCYRYLYLIMARRLRDVDIAQRIERRFPQLNERLSSSIEFVRQTEDDREAGSAALRRAVIVETTAEVERLDLSEVLERRPTRRALAGAGAICLLAALVVVLDPLTARLAVARLINPFGHAAWPKKNHLQFRNPPTRLASGQPFEVELIDGGGPLPDQVRIHYLDENEGRQTEEVESMHLLNSVMVARRENVTRPFAYRAEGGDDGSMDWQRVEVVEPPKIESLKFELHPPAYTGWPTERSESQIVALRGTHVAVRAMTTKPLGAAVLHQENGPTLTAQISDDGHGFNIAADGAEPWVIDRSGSYWFELCDSAGLSGGAESRWEVRAVVDQPPTVAIEQPTANAFVTPTAIVVLRALAKDDLALKSVTLHFSRSDETDVEEFTVPLYAGPETVEPAATGMSAGASGESQIIEHPWNLAALNLKPGAQVSFYAAADDYLPQTGRSSPRQLSIISPQELEDRIAQRQSLVLAELRRVLKMQQDTRGQTGALEIQLEAVGRLGKQDLDHAQGAELNQRQVTRTLTSPTEGVPAHIAGLMADLESNKVDSPEIGRRMRGVLDEIHRLETEHLTPIERELTGAIKQAQAELNSGAAPPPKQKPPSGPVAQGLASAAGHQDEVVRALERMLNDFSEWDSYRRFGREVAQIAREQEEVDRATTELGAKTLAKEFKDLEPQQQADLKKLGGRQADLARRFDKVQQQMEDARQRLQDSEPLPAATISDALHLVRRQGTSGQMRNAGSQLERNQVGQAARAQEQVTKDLAEMLDVLANRREHELNRLVKKLSEAETELADMRRRQAGLGRKLADAAAKEKSAVRRRELERLTREQKQLQEEIGRLARRLERLQAERAGQTAAGGAGKMQRSAGARQQGDDATADEQMERAQQDLDQAQQQLAERRKEAQADLAREQMARIRDGLNSLHERQQQVVAETQRLEGLRSGRPDRSRAQTSSVRSLARQQKSLQDESLLLAEKVSAAEVFHLALTRAAQDMAQAVAQLDRGETGTAAQRPEQQAEKRLARLLEALKPGQPKQANGANSGSGDQQGGNENAIRAIAELKLLKLMQADLNERFKNLSEDSLPAVDRQAELVDLSDEQGRLADLTLKLSQPTEDNPEDDPQKLPDMRQDEAGQGHDLQDALLPTEGEP